MAKLFGPELGVKFMGDVRVLTTGLWWVCFVVRFSLVDGGIFGGEGYLCEEDVHSFVMITARARGFDRISRIEFEGRLPSCQVAPSKEGLKPCVREAPNMCLSTHSHRQYIEAT
jgi:hypothetical protein